ncbi:HEAT repeat domain-containing protein [Lacipirellula sp.]|uniref:HEAT repeat domain-containing protein n=1 Tax=Lacipirellula sp. TaxID=2691419 RepID=UPI003D0D1345
MIDRFSILSSLSAFAATLALVSSLSAQEPAADPAAAAAPTLAEFARRDPAIASVLELKRTTPAEQLRAILMLIDLGHADVAAQLLPELIAAKLDDAQKAALVGEFGTAKFLKLIRLDPPVAKDATPNQLAGVREFAQSCIIAADAAAKDPKRIAQLIAQLNAPTEGERYAARVDLRAAGDAGMLAAINALAEAKDEAVRGNLLAALADMRPAIDAPLLALLADSQGQLRRDAAELAGHLHVAGALPWLSTIAVTATDSSAESAARKSISQLGYPEPTIHEVQKLLRDRLAAIKSTPVTTFDDGTVGVWWSWNPQTKQLAAATYGVPQLRALTAARLARALGEVGGLTEPNDRRAVLLYSLEESALLGRGADASLKEVVGALTPSELSTTLATAMKEQYTAAAVMIAEELGRRGDLSILSSNGGMPSPLAAALTSPDRAVRFAALGAIMQLNPQRSFPGSSQVAKSLWYFVGGAGEPTAIAAAPAILVASDWAGKLRGQGYDAMPVKSGREALVAAIDPAVAPRLGVIVLDSDIGQPLLGEVVYQLRASDLTANVPILIAASGPRFASAQRVAEANSLVYATPRPQGDGSLANVVKEALALKPTPLASTEVRTAQAKQALEWLAKLLAENAPYDELKRDAFLVDRTLMAPELADPSVTVLAGLGTPESQTALVDFASVTSLPIETRQAAADALAASVKRFGVQLKREQVVSQYDRYNASETADKPTQELMGRILDVIEKKDTAAQK